MDVQYLCSGFGIIISAIFIGVLLVASIELNERKQRKLYDATYRE